LFAIDGEGTILISKLTFSEEDKEAMKWVPLKLLNASSEELDAK